MKINGYQIVSETVASKALKKFWVGPKMTGEEKKVLKKIINKSHIDRAKKAGGEYFPGIGIGAGSTPKTPQNRVNLAAYMKNRMLEK